MTHIYSLLPTVLFMLLNLLPMAANGNANTPPDVVGLNSPLRLNADTTTLRLADYFLDLSRISRIESLHNEVQIKWQKGDVNALLTATAQLPPLSVLTVTLQNDKQYAILLQRSHKVKHIVSLPDTENRYREVQIAGGFNNWNPKNNPFVKKGQQWQTELVIDPGVYQYKIVTDGNWHLDPYNPDSADNNIGGFNSVLKILGNTQTPPKAAITAIDDKGKISLYTDQTDTQPLLFWNNQYISDLPTPRKTSDGWHYEGIALPKEARKTERSWLRLYVCNTKQVGSDQLVPLSYGKPVTKATQLTRTDKETTILYFLMIDRFADANPANNFAVKDERVLPPANYMGGDLSGITRQIKQGYFNDLGINTLWISPITQNALGAYQEYPEPRRWFSGYHGYWPISNNTVDIRFGTDKDFTTLVTQAHQNNLNVLLDLVANHVHEEHPIYKAHPQWATPLILPDGRTNIRLWDEHRLTTWFDPFLPTLDYEKPEVVRFMVDSSLYWIQQYGIDGFRHDATKHIPNVFWQSLTERLKREIIVPRQKSVLQIGETYGSRELIGSYVGSGQMDGQFDFNLYFDARAVFALDNEPFDKLQTSLHESLNYYGYHSLMGNISGNHDMARFNSYASEALRFDENAKEAGWSRRIEIVNPIGYQKTALLLAFIATIPGIPVLYYGDEIGMAGGDDPDNRRPMRFDQLTEHETRLKATTAQLFQLRRSNMALLYGDTEFLSCSDTTWAYSRRYFDQQAIVVFNKGKQAAILNLPVPDSKSKQIWTIAVESGGAAITDKGKQIELPPYSFAILVN